LTKKKVLGRGLSSFLTDNINSIEQNSGPVFDKSTEKTIMSVPIEDLIPNPDQPRKEFDQSDLKELSATIKEKGILQPLLVVRDGNYRYKIVAGERRWRAAQLAQIHEVPIIVKDLTNEEIIEIAIIENVQRAQLSPLEEAESYLNLSEKFKYKHEYISKIIGKSRPYVSNLIRLMSLPDEVKKCIRSGSLSSGHARALLNAEDPVGLSRLIVKKGLSVRQTEFLAKRQNRDDKGQDKLKSLPTEKDPDTIELERSLTALLRIPITISYDRKKKSGKVHISYGSIEELDLICGILKSCNND
jgi:ParB family chromosome partitioning protein